mgnify:CR=1 FL=1
MPLPENNQYALVLTAFGKCKNMMQDEEVALVPACYGFCTGLMAALAYRQQVLVVQLYVQPVHFRQAHHHAQRTPARDDRRLVDRVRGRHQVGEDGVTTLVIGGQPLLLLGHDHRAPLGAHHDLVLGVLEFAVGNQPLVTPRGEQRRLVDQVGQVRAREAGGAARDGAMM